MNFLELINRSDFLKINFKDLEDHFKEIEINGISNNSKNIKKNFILTDISKNLIATYLLETSLGLYHLHSLGISHCDLKGDNMIFKDLNFKLSLFPITEIKLLTIRLSIQHTSYPIFLNCTARL